MAVAVEEEAAALRRSFAYIEKEFDAFQQEILRDAAKLEQGIEKEIIMELSVKK